MDIAATQIYGTSLFELNLKGFSWIHMEITNYKFL